MDASDVIAGLALVVSGLAWWQSRRSASASLRSADAADRSADAADRSATSAESMSTIDIARHREERRPRWNVGLRATRRGRTVPPCLTLELVRPEAMDHVTILSLDDGKLTFIGGQEGCQFDGDRVQTERPILQGRTLSWQVRTPDPPRGGKSPGGGAIKAQARRVVRRPRSAASRSTTPRVLPLIGRATGWANPRRRIFAMCL